MKKKSSKAPKGRSQLDEFAMTDSDNELDDLFASGADRVGLTKDGGDSEDEIDEEAVYDMDDEVCPRLHPSSILVSVKFAWARCMP